MQQHEDDYSEDATDMRENLRHLSFDHGPRPMLEDRVAGELRKRRLIGTEFRRASAARNRGRVALTWPAAAAAAALFFASGLFLGAVSSRGERTPVASQVAQSAPSDVSSAPPEAELMLASDRRKDVIRAIRF